MGCVNPDGSLSTQARSILDVLETSNELDDVARKTGLPLYRVRAAVRELIQAGLVEEVDGGHRATEAGRTRTY
jgi:DNA-binding IclR family transcriptional regulator